MELTSDEKKLICEEYDALLDRKHHITEYLPKSYISKLDISEKEQIESLNETRARRAKGIASRISTKYPSLGYNRVYNYILNPDFALQTEVPNNALNTSHPTLEDTLVIREVEEQYLIEQEATFRIKGLILTHATNLVPISRIRRIKFSDNLFCIIIEQTLFLKDEYEFADGELESMTYKEIKKFWNQIINDNMAYEPVEGPEREMFTSQEEFNKYTKSEYGYVVNEEDWHHKGEIYLDNRYQKKPKNSDQSPKEAIRTLVKQRKYNKKA